MRKEVWAILASMALSGAAVGRAAALVPPIPLTPSPMELLLPSMLNPCQPGTPCGDAAAKEGMAPGQVLAQHPYVQGLRSSPPPRSASIAAASTVYSPSPPVSARVKAAFIQQIQKSMPADDARRITEVIASRDLIGAWDRQMASQGLQTNDLVDAVASFWVLNWVIANRSDMSTAQVQAVRDQLRRRLATRGAPALANDARQAAAEMVKIRFVLQSTLYTTALKGGDQGVLGQLSDQAEQQFQAEMKVDLRRVRLTAQGFALQS